MVSSAASDLDRFRELYEGLRNHRDSLARCIADAFVSRRLFPDSHDVWARSYRMALHDEKFAYALFDAAFSAYQSSVVNAGDSHAV